MSSGISYLKDPVLRPLNFDSIAPSKEEFKEGLQNWCDEKLGLEEYDNRQKAREIIENCYYYKWDKIALADLGLTSIPEEICALESLEILDLSHNKIEALPFRLYQLTNLKQFILDGNPIKSLPFTILSFPQQCEITFEGCDKLDSAVVASIKKNQNSLHRRGIFPCHGLCADFQTHFEDPLH